MQKVSFTAQEYQKSATFERHEYSYRGSVTEGWRVERDGQPWLTLPEGYKLVRTRYCGVCSTDLSRHFLPFELPQVTGHEVVGFEVEPGEESRPIDYFELKLANGSFPSFCGADLVKPLLWLWKSTRAVARVAFPQSHRIAFIVHLLLMMVWIDSALSALLLALTAYLGTLPSRLFELPLIGFSPYLLAPRASLVPVPRGLSLSIAALWEPFAAALHGVASTPNISNSSIAVLGPRKLGLMVVAALSMYKKKLGLYQDVSSMSITAVARHKNLLEMCRRLGAEAFIYTSGSSDSPRPQSFDIVFDTTGSASGFSLAIKLAKKIIHLKSTSGAKIFGMEQLTPMVIDEISLLPFSRANLSFSWPNEAPRSNVNAYVSPSVPKHLYEDLAQPSSLKFHQMSVADGFEMISSDKLVTLGSSLPRFDLAIVTSVEEADQVIRPRRDSLFSLVRARGAILFAKSTNTYENELLSAVTGRGLEIRTSRCGDAHESLKFLKENSALAEEMEKILFTYRMGLSEMNKAFDLARKSEACLKILVDTSSSS